MRSRGQISGVIFMILGIFLICWAQAHSPHDQGMTGTGYTGSYSLSEPWYYICFGLGIVLGIIGVLNAYRSM